MADRKIFRHFDNGKPNPSFNIIMSRGLRLTKGSKFFCLNADLYEATTEGAPPYRIKYFKLIRAEDKRHLKIVKRFKDKFKDTPRAISIMAIEEEENFRGFAGFIPENNMNNSLQLTFNSYAKSSKIASFSDIRITDFEVVYCCCFEGANAPSIHQELMSFYKNTNKDYTQMNIPGILFMQNFAGKRKLKCEMGKCHFNISSIFKVRYKHWLEVHVNTRDFRVPEKIDTDKFTLLDLE